MRDWSAIPKQQFLSENGEIGDCWRCCIAAVLDLPAEEVPHFLLAGDGTANASGMDADTQEWLHKRGLAIIGAPGRSGMAFIRWSDSEIEELVTIACGPSPRSTAIGQHHAVVMRGDELLYDPHPSEAGLTAITERWLIFRPVCL